MNAARDGTLLVTRWFRPRGNGRMSIGSLIADSIDPRYDVTVMLAVGPLIAPNRHEQVYDIRGKGTDGITVEDNGRPARVTGRLAQERPDFGTFTRAKIEFLAPHNPFADGSAPTDIELAAHMQANTDWTDPS